jgi:elongation factor Ts
MTSISASTVKELRDKTGAGMMDCKAALTESGGDVEAAVDWLRTKGLAKAAKKAGRLASEGLIGLASDGPQGALVEVNSETDFVARNEKFQEAVGKIAELALGAGGDLGKLAAMTYPGSEATVDEQVKELIATIGENMDVRRTVQLGVDKGVVASYLHNSVAPGLGKIGVLVALESEGDEQALAAFGKQLAMHIAATSPLAVSTDELDADVVERERAILVEQAKESGKPDEVIEKMVEGRLRKYFEEVVLLSQTFVIDGESKVDQAVKAAEAQIGSPIKVVAFERIALGEGLDKKEEDFAAEVAAVASGG